MQRGRGYREIVQAANLIRSVHRLLAWCLLLLGARFLLLFADEPFEQLSRIILGEGRFHGSFYTLPGDEHVDQRKDELVGLTFTYIRLQSVDGWLPIFSTAWTLIVNAGAYVIDTILDVGPLPLTPCDNPANALSRFCL